MYKGNMDKFWLFRGAYIEAAPKALVFSLFKKSFWRYFVRLLQQLAIPYSVNK